MVAAGIGPQNWREPETVALPDDYLPAYPTLVRQLVWRRGHRQPAEALQFLNPLEFRLPPPGTYTSLAVAADRVDVAINTQEQIWVWGDFDADGQTSTAVLVGALRKLGARVSYFIPNRLTESHGLKAPQLDSIVEAGCRVLITCDCGTNDAAVVDYANSKGLDVIITDHHQQTGPIPRAVAVCNSSHFSPADPLNGAPGVAMAYLLVRELFERRSRGQDVQQELDLVALGIIADLAPGSPANRAFLARGLPRLWREPRPGVRALLKLIGVPSETLETLKISFKLAPLLNAAGRLADARLGVDLLLASDDETAVGLASRLQALNQERQRMTEVLEAEINAGMPSPLPDQPAFFAVGDDWHLGLIGPAASRYASRFGRPAAIISRNGDGLSARGSVRSNGGYDVLAALATQSHLLSDWGGHPGAAGFSLEAVNIDAFSVGFMDAVRTAERQSDGIELCVDAEVQWSSVDVFDMGPASLYGSVTQLAPYAESNPTPILMTRSLRLAARRPFGKDEAFADLIFVDDLGNSRVLKWWRHDRSWRASGRYDIAYTVGADVWQGRSRVRLTLVSARPAMS